MAENLAKDLIASLKSAGFTLATAESCTGGLIADAIVSCPGASAVYLGGAITYTNEMKISLLGVSPDIIAVHTEVSAECAEAMAQGAVKTLGSDIALSSTGYAGPDGEHVGLVYLGCAHPGGVTFKKLELDGDRQTIRRRAALEALSLALEISKTKNQHTLERQKK